MTLSNLKAVVKCGAQPHAAHDKNCSASVVPAEQQPESAQGLEPQPQLNAVASSSQRQLTPTPDDQSRSRSLTQDDGDGVDEDADGEYNIDEDAVASPREESVDEADVTHLYLEEEDEPMQRLRDFEEECIQLPAPELAEPEAERPQGGRKGKGKERAVPSGRSHWGDASCCREVPLKRDSRKLCRSLRKDA
ncbi:hypothetical protein PQX77_017377 [Marasmius sp. AFHP31]|nr:hypothetical protein PQX77_017377 [Marasmius sp. AFHP31]